MDLTYLALKYKIEFVPGLGIFIWPNSDGWALGFYEDGDVKFSPKGPFTEAEIMEIYHILTPKLLKQRAESQTMLFHNPVSIIRREFMHDAC